tara:strand:+ start:135012 stop:135167 length:156 start_codon:yes stop_codon:yes gene_type:complete
LRNRITGQVEGDENGGNGIGKNQHTILRYLRVGDALHTAHNRVDEDNTHAH